MDGILPVVRDYAAICDFAREKYKPEIMIPGQASLLVCGFYDEAYFQVSTILRIRFIQKVTKLRTSFFVHSL